MPKMASNTSIEYDYNFIGEPDDDLKCLICLEVARDPWQHGECGRIFCEECLEEYGKDNVCPLCSEQPQYFKDNRSKRHIKALPVKCDNIMGGCEWEGTVGTLDEHIEKCQFTLVSCPNKCEEDDNVGYIMRKDLNEHLEKECPNRNHKCEYCGEEDTYANITKIHDNECGKKPLPCSNTECTKKVKRAKLQGHLEDDCEFSEISCKYESIGCDVKRKRKDMREHEQDDKVHLQKALDIVVELRKMSDNTLRKGEALVFKLTGYEMKKNNNEIFYSPSFYTSTDGYHICVMVYPGGNGDGKGTHISIFTLFLKGKHDKNLNWPFTGNVTFELLNQLEDKNHKSRKTEYSENQKGYIGHNGWGIPKLIEHSKLLHDSVNNTQYLRDNTLYFRVTVEVSGHQLWLECTTK